MIKRIIISFISALFISLSYASDRPQIFNLVLGQNNLESFRKAFCEHDFIYAGERRGAVNVVGKFAGKKMDVYIVGEGASKTVTAISMNSDILEEDTAAKYALELIETIAVRYPDAKFEQKGLGGFFILKEGGVVIDMKEKSDGQYVIEFYLFGNNINSAGFEDL